MKATTKKAKDSCKKYGIAITNYVLGEAMNIPRDELFNHLKSCEKCRDELFNWQDTCAVMRTEAHFAKPETKKKYAELLEKIKTAPVKMVQGKPVLDHQEKVGLPAGAVWRYLAKNGWVNINDLARKVRLHPDTTKLAVGWLIHEKKVYYTEEKQDTLVYLNETEREIYQNQARV